MSFYTARVKSGKAQKEQMLSALSSKRTSRACLDMSAQCQEETSESPDPPEVLSFVSLQASGGCRARP